MCSHHDAITYYCLYFKTSFSIRFGMHKMEITLVPILLGNAWFKCACRTFSTEFGIKSVSQFYLLLIIEVLKA